MSFVNFSASRALDRVTKSPMDCLCWHQTVGVNYTAGFSISKAFNWYIFFSYMFPKSVLCTNLMAHVNVSALICSRPVINYVWRTCIFSLETMKRTPSISIMCKMIAAVQVKVYTMLCKCDVLYSLCQNSY